MATIACTTTTSSTTKPQLTATLTITRRNNRPYKVEEDDDDDLDAITDVPFSQEAQEIRRLERTGAMSHVVGETSILSQEILILTQPDGADGTHGYDVLSNDNPNKHLIAFTGEQGYCANVDANASLSGVAAAVASSSHAAITDDNHDNQEKQQIRDKLETSQRPTQMEGTFSLPSIDLQWNINVNMNMQAFSQTTFLGSFSQTTLGPAISQEGGTDGTVHSQSLSQGTFQASQLSAMSVLMDAAELMSKSQNTICGVILSDSYADSQLSTVTTRSKRATATSQTENIIPKRVTRSFQKSTCTATNAVASKSPPSTVHVHIKATPSTMIVNVPPSANTATNNKKRKAPDAITPTVAAVNVVPTKATTFKLASRNSKSNCDDEGTDLSPQKKKKWQKEKDRKTACEMAQCAAQLAAQTIASPEVAKNLLLSMALVRINPRAAPAQWPVRGTVIRDGFFWGTYPPLETILRRNMREYYELSTTKCQSKLQQKFNNRLTVEIRAESDKYGWIFAENFDDKVLRDRIRCFFKTHIQK